MNSHYQANKPDEILDLVNERDEVIGQVRRQEANQDPKLIHREVAVLLFDDQRRVLLQKRSSFKTVLPDMWSIGCAGHILKGGDPETTAHEELQEELGFDTKLVFITKRLRVYPHESHFMHYFLAKYNGEKFKLELAEVAAVKFLDKAGLQNLLASGEQVNQNHFDVYQDFWGGKFAEAESKLVMPAQKVEEMYGCVQSKKVFSKKEQKQHIKFHKSSR